MNAWKRTLFLGLLILSLFVQNEISYSKTELEVRFSPGADGESVHYSASFRDPLGGSNSGGGSQITRKKSPLYWERHEVNVFDECNPAQYEGSNWDVPLYLNEAIPDGQEIWANLIDRRTGEFERTVVYCQVSNVQGQQLTPDPPSYTDIWNALNTGIFDQLSTASAAYVAPPAPGLTGLPTNIWAQFPDGQSITQDVGLPCGYRLQASAQITEVTIFVTSPAGNRTTLTTLRPNQSGTIDGGSFSNPASQHRFRSTGTHVITTAIIWSGSDAILSGGFLTSPIVVPIGDVRLELNRDYPVQQLRPALVK